MQIFHLPKNKFILDPIFGDIYKCQSIPFQFHIVKDYLLTSDIGIIC
jgi:hypothetical protein